MGSKPSSSPFRGGSAKESLMAQGLGNLVFFVGLRAFVQGEALAQDDCIGSGALGFGHRVSQIRSPRPKHFRLCDKDRSGP